MVPLTRKERDRQLRQQDILKAAEHVFAVKGFHKATIQDIAKDAQYASGTIYLYFKDKDDLYLALLEKKIQSMLSSIQEKVDRMSNTHEKIKALVEEQLAYFTENQDFFRIYFSERQGVRWTIKDKIPATAVSNFMKHMDYISGIIKKAQDEGVIRKDFDSRQLASVLTSMINALILRWMKDESYKKDNLKEASGFILDIFLNGAGKNK
jgi:TetR/AcrR family fatty acid metabolism transcriptional regulator